MRITRSSGEISCQSAIISKARVLLGIHNRQGVGWSMVSQGGRQASLDSHLAHPVGHVGCPLVIHRSCFVPGGINLSAARCQTVLLVSAELGLGTGGVEPSVTRRGWLIDVASVDNPMSCLDP